VYAIYAISVPYLLLQNKHKKQNNINTMFYKTLM